MIHVDFHGHYIPVREIESGNHPVTVRYDDGRALLGISGETRAPAGPDAFDLDRLLDDMARSRLDKRVIAIPPFCFQYELPAEDGVRWSATLNDALALAVQRAPDRLVGFGTVPLQDPGAAARELERSRNELSLHGVEIASNINGVDLDAPELNVFWEAASGLKTPILIHPHYVAGMERMGDYHLRNLVGNPLETSLAAARLMFGGVLDRYPDLVIILSHGGGTLPYIIGRLRHGFSVRDEARLHTESSPADLLQRLYYDIVVFDSAVLRFLVDQAGADRVVIGTDYPFDMSEVDPVTALERAGLTEDERSTIAAVSESLLAM